MIGKAFTVGLLIATGGWNAAHSEELTVFSAASLTDAITEISTEFEQATGHTVTPVFASSSTLARQIESGAPAHIFLSASLGWMDYLEERALIEPTSRLDLVANSLVLIAPSDVDLSLDDLAQLPDALGDDNRLAIGDPDHVPAGIYAAEALAGLGLWDDLASRTARSGTVRAALALVERGETPFGIVYTTDAVITDGVRVIATLPQDSHRPIVYPASVVANLNETEGQVASDYLRFLAGDDAADLFRRHGFLPVTDNP